MSSPAPAPPSSLNAFLARSHARLQEVLLAPSAAVDVHIVMGNEAADPDSCVCAIALAAALDVSLGGDVLVAPLVAVPRADFKLQLDRVHLLRRAGLEGGGDGPQWTPTHVSFADELDPAAFIDAKFHLHLVDHNKLSATYSALASTVVSITDHHADEGMYKASVADADRLVELGIGSCASLVAERVRALHAPLLSDGSLCALLLGALILDTVNLDASAKPQKAREAVIAREALLPAAAPALGFSPTADGLQAVFDELLAVKADTTLLLGFPTADLLRQDYKEEALVGGESGGGGGAAAVSGGEGGTSTLRVGVGSVVLPLPMLLARQPTRALAAELRAYADERSLRLLVLMSVDLSARQRYVLVHCAEAALREAALQAMQPLRLTPIALDAGVGSEGASVACKEPESETASLLAFAVGDYNVSRKVLMPILRGLSGAA